MSSGTPQVKRGWRPNALAFLVALIGLVGLGILLYPSTASWWSQYHQSQAIVAYAAKINDEVHPGNDFELSRAHQYNEMLGSGEVIVGSASRKPTTDLERAQMIEVDGAGYWDLLPGVHDTMARLKIPSINVDLPVYHGTADETLERGVGHLQGTSLPVGGSDTHAVLTAHTGLAKATLFNNLNEVEVGETFTVEVFGDVLTYRVLETRVVLPDESEAIRLQAGKDLMTLVTCTPLGINTHRYLVTGERITPTPLEDVEEALAEPDIPGFPWWSVAGSAGIAVMGAYVWRAGYPPRRAKKAPADAGSSAPSAP
ncbi:class C sortase [Actinomyces minihominis]|uniref:class C sortase n=1 Tax=Actinomyces minihominis TaxID=2002838 RepID=UPI000C08C2E6|nr:class C sortase [Actinomyces minihominis]